MQQFYPEFNEYFFGKDPRSPFNSYKRSPRYPEKQDEFQTKILKTESNDHKNKNKNKKYLITEKKLTPNKTNQIQLKHRRIIYQSTK